MAYLQLKKFEVEKLVETTNCSLFMLMAGIQIFDLMVQFYQKKNKKMFLQYISNLQAIPIKDKELKIKIGIKKTKWYFNFAWV